MNACLSRPKEQFGPEQPLFAGIKHKAILWTIVNAPRLTVIAPPMAQSQHLIH